MQTFAREEELCETPLRTQRIEGARTDARYDRRADGQDSEANSSVVVNEIAAKLPQKVVLGPKTRVRDKRPY